MSKYRNIFVFIGLFVIFALLAIPILTKTTEPELSKEEMKRTIKKTISQLKIYGLDLETLDEKMKMVSSKVDDPTYTRLATWQIGDVKLQIEVSTGKIVWMENELLTEKIFRKRDTHGECIYPRESQAPTKQRSEMHHLANEYLEIILGRIPENVKLDKEITRKGIPEISRKDVWLIHWDRYIDGYEYPHDGITMEISEQFGLVGYCYYIVSKHVDLTINILKEEALNLGKKYIRKAIKQFNNQDPPGGIYDYGYNSVKVLYDKPRIENIALMEPYVDRKSWQRGDKSKRAALVWEVLFRSYKKGDFKIYINATNGKYLGYRYDYANWW